MSVYVDSARNAYGRMYMCHMIADSSEELLAMAEKIGVQKQWLQNPGTPREHFDICSSKRKLAVQSGAIEVEILELGMMLLSRSKKGREILARAACKEEEK